MYAIYKKYISLNDAIQILQLCGVKRDIIEEIPDLSEFCDGGLKDGGWGSKFERETVISQSKQKLLQNKDVRLVLHKLRFIRRINKYKERGFKFSYNSLSA